MTPVLNRRVTLERSTITKDAHGAPVSTWAVAAVVWAERRDEPPSRAEQASPGMERSRTRVRYRMRWRSDVTLDMRIRDGGEILQIIGGPAELGRREYLEVTAERVKPA